MGEDTVQVGQGTDDDVDAGHHDQKAQQRFERAFGDLAGGFFLQQQSQHGDKGNQDRRLAQQIFDDKIDQTTHDGGPSCRALSKRPQSFAQFPLYR
ncbi:hypothetical protein D3C80_1567020 [compost metagenome]